MRWVRRRTGDPEAGITLVELLVSLLLAGFLGAAVTSWMITAVRTANHHRDDDWTVQELRQASERITRELRMASALVNASGAAVVVWIDENWDGEVDEGETVTWAVSGAGELTRSTDAGDEWVVMTGLVPAESGFSFDAESPEEIRTVRIVLVGSLGNDAGNTRTLETQVFLRNN